MIRSFVQVFEQVGEDRGGEDNVHIYVAVQLIDKFGNVRCYSPVLLRHALVMHPTVVINVGGISDWVGEAIDAFVSSPALTCLSCKMIASMCHKFADLGSERWVVVWQFHFNDFVDERNRDIWPYLVTHFVRSEGQRRLMSRLT